MCEGGEFRGGEGKGSVDPRMDRIVVRIEKMIMVKIKGFAKGARCCFTRLRGYPWANADSQRMKPRRVCVPSRARMTAEVAGVERRPSLPIQMRATPATPTHQSAFRTLHCCGTLIRLLTSPPRNTLIRLLTSLPR